MISKAIMQSKVLDLWHALAKIEGDPVMSYGYFPGTDWCRLTLVHRGKFAQCTLHEDDLLDDVSERLIAPMINALVSEIQRQGRAA